MRIKLTEDEMRMRDNCCTPEMGRKTCYSYIEPVISDAEMLDISKASQSNYYCVFNKIPNLIFYIQSFSLPSATNRKIQINMPNHASMYNVAGHTTDYEPMTINFIMDENFLCYFRILEWMRKNEIVENFEDAISRMTLVILNNAKIPIIKVNFRDVFPDTLGDITFSNMNSNSLTFYSMFSTYNYSVEYIDKQIRIPCNYGII